MSRPKEKDATMCNIKCSYKYPNTRLVTYILIKLLFTVPYAFFMISSPVDVVEPLTVDTQSCRYIR
jgi:hypothetical protein